MEYRFMLSVAKAHQLLGAFLKPITQKNFVELKRISDAQSAGNQTLQEVQRLFTTRKLFILMRCFTPFDLSNHFAKNLYSLFEFLKTELSNPE